jgi:hypothetical protein
MPIARLRAVWSSRAAGLSCDCAVSVSADGPAWKPLVSNPARHGNAARCSRAGRRKQRGQNKQKEVQVQPRLRPTASRRPPLH